MDNVINTDRLQLRKWKADNLPSLIQMNQDEEVMKYFPATMTEDESVKFYLRIQKHFEDHGFGLYVVEDKVKKQFLGYTGFMTANFEATFTPCVEIGWRFNKAYWGKGYATEAANACLAYGFSKLPFEKVYSFTSIHNKKSEAVMQRIGMQYIGEFNHPKIAIDHYLCLHVNYLIQKNNII